MRCLDNEDIDVRRDGGVLMSAMAAQQLRPININVATMRGMR